MMSTVFLGYSCAIIMASAGYALLGGASWMWCVAAWLAGAPLTLMVAWLRTLSFRPRVPKKLHGVGQSQTGMAHSSLAQLSTDQTR